uniref:Uncharacterized protein n=1 Tax=Anopheles dirus TaxID=7168 RepID=A0A182N1M2_9DIPT
MFQKACADIVAIVTADLQRERHLQQQSAAVGSTGPVSRPPAVVAASNGLPQGESLLLPLLQGLLLSNAAAFGYKGANTTVGNGAGVKSSSNVVSGSSAGGGSSHTHSTNVCNSGGSGSSNGGGSSSSISHTGSMAMSKMPPVEDSGTESGEDLRLLAAAGLHDRGAGVGAVGLGSAGGLPSLLCEVAAALERLQLSLQGDVSSGGQPDVIQLDTEQRRALLALIARLQQGLQQPDKIADLTGFGNGGAITADEANVGSARRQSQGALNGDAACDGERGSPGLDTSQGRSARAGSSRFGAKRRTNRNNRHTVGVSREELADARRFIEEMVMMDGKQQSEQCVTAPEQAYLLQKQHSLGTVLGPGPAASSVPQPVYNGAAPAATPATAFAMKRPSQFVPKEMQHAQASLDKLVLPGAGTKLAAANPVPPVRTKQSSTKEKLLLRQSLSVDQALPPGAGNGSASEKQDPVPAGSTKPIDLHKHRVAASVVKQQAPQPETPFKKPTQTVAQRALVKKYSFNDGSSSDEDEQRRAQRKTADEPKKTAEQMVLRNKITTADHHEPAGSVVINTVQQIVSREAKPDVAGKASTTVSRRQPLQNGSRTPDSPKDDMSGRPLSKYANKKLRMKRANTIDLPKALPQSVAGDNAHGDVEGDAPHPRALGYTKRAPAVRATLGRYALPPTGPSAVPLEVPDFKPRTENDLKFMAFLQKQNQQARQIWSNPVREHVGSNNWTNKFDHLKSNFEHAERRDRSELPPKYGAAPKASAMSFWQQAEHGALDEGAGKGGAVKQHQHRQSHAKSLTPNHTSSFKPMPAAAIGSARTAQSMGKYSSPTTAHTSSSPVVEGKLVLVPEAAVNQFSHAPASAFKPIPKKLPPANMEFKPIQHEPGVVKPVPARTSTTTGLVKQLVAIGFKETPEVKPEPMQVQLGLVRSLAAQGYQETPYVPLPKLERTPTHNVLNYKPRTDASCAGEPAPAAPWVGKRSSELSGSTGSRVASIASTKFTANSFGHHKPVLPVQQPLTYQGSLKYAEKPYAYQQPTTGGSVPYEKRPSLPDVSSAHLGTYTFTDYTPPASVSTFTLNRSDSLTNPENAPLVLTNTNSVFSPTAADAANLLPPQISYLSVNEPHAERSSSHSSANGEDDEDEYDGDDRESIDSQEMRVVSKVMQAPQGQQATYSAARRTTHLKGGYDADGRGSLIAQSLHTSLKKIKDKSPTPPKSLQPVRIVTPQVEITEPAQPAQPARPVPAHAIYNNVQPHAMHRLADHASLARTKSSHNLAVPPTQAPRPISTEKQRTVEAYFTGSRPTGYVMSRSGSNQNLVMRDKCGLGVMHNSVRPVSYAMGHSGSYYGGDGGATPVEQQRPQQSQGHGYVMEVPYRHHLHHAHQMQRHGPSNGYLGGPTSNCHQHHPHAGGLLRSRTMPHIPMGLALLDENNVEDAFEELMNQSFAV